MSHVSRSSKAGHTKLSGGGGSCMHCAEHGGLKRTSQRVSHFASPGGHCLTYGRWCAKVIEWWHCCHHQLLDTLHSSRVYVWVGLCPAQHGRYDWLYLVETRGGQLTVGTQMKVRQGHMVIAPMEVAASPMRCSQLGCV